MTKGELIDAIEFIKTITSKKIINAFLLRFSYFISKTLTIYLHWGKIESLSIEPTNLCNLKCPECPSGNNSMTRSRVFLAINHFENTINQIASHLTYLQLFFQGEPFLHPKIFEFINYAAKNKIYTSTSTNGQFLTASHCEKIVKSGLHRLIISVDGTTQEVYERYRVGGSLDLVLNGTSELIKTKNKLKSRTPFVILQFVVFATNEHQLPDIIKLAKALKVDKLEIKTAQIENFEMGSPLIPKNKKYSRYIPTKNGSFQLNRTQNFTCKRIWKGAVVSAENKLLPCCFDKNAEYSYNYKTNKNIIDNWKSDKAAAFRKLIWSKENSIEMCKNCTEGLK
jgi:MoaA/NifB/PqqE/SkfB family radical SAM enzyme